MTELFYYFILYIVMYTEIDILLSGLVDCVGFLFSVICHYSYLLYLMVWNVEEQQTDNCVEQPLKRNDILKDTKSLQKQYMIWSVWG
jgi:hypothetical protein